MRFDWIKENEHCTRVEVYDKDGRLIDTGMVIGRPCRDYFDVGIVIENPNRDCEVSSRGSIYDIFSKSSIAYVVHGLMHLTASRDSGKEICEEVLKSHGYEGLEVERYSLFGLYIGAQGNPVSSAINITEIKSVVEEAFCRSLEFDYSKELAELQAKKALMDEGKEYVNP